MNDGENRVFPIQVSRQELLLFLGAVILMETYKNMVLYGRPNCYRVNFLHLRGTLPAGDAIGEHPTQKWKLKGKKSSPSRSIVKCVIFITVAIMFIFSTAQWQAEVVPAINILF